MVCRSRRTHELRDGYTESTSDAWLWRNAAERERAGKQGEISEDETGMNAKLCKRLRKDAREITIGMAPRRLVIKKFSVAFHGGQRMAECAVNDPQTTRGVYLRMKLQRRCSP